MSDETIEVPVTRPARFGAALRASTTSWTDSRFPSPERLPAFCDGDYVCLVEDR